MDIEDDAETINEGNGFVDDGIGDDLNDASNDDLDVDSNEDLDDASNDDLNDDSSDDLDDDSNDDLDDDSDAETFCGWEHHPLLDELRIAPLQAREGGKIGLLDDSRKVAFETEESNLKLQKGGGAVWDLLPEEISKDILYLLPAVAKARLRCVRRHWYKLLYTSLPLLFHGRDQRSSPCTIMRDQETQKASFFCHTELRWFTVPPLSSTLELALNNLEEESEIVAADGGLLCYMKRRRHDVYLFGVHNPMTQFSLVLPPINDPGGVVDFVRLIVDRRPEAPKFYVIVVTDHTDSLRCNRTYVFDSTYSLLRWVSYGTFPTGSTVKNFFFRQNLLYMWNASEFPMFQYFDIEAEMTGDYGKPWDVVRYNKSTCWKPDRTHPFSHSFMLDAGDRLILVQLNASEDPMLIWKLQNSGPHDHPRFTPAYWELLTVACHPDMTTLAAGRFRAFMFANGESVCFTGDTNEWLVYSLATKTWHEMPECGGEHLGHRREWLQWEPSFDAEGDSAMALTSPE